MKRVYALFAVLLTCWTSYAQIAPEDIPFDEHFFFVFNSDVPSKTKMTNARSWIAESFGDYKAVLQFEDEGQNRIIIKGVSKIETNLFLERGGREEYNAHYLIKFDFKDDRYRISFENIKIFHYKLYGRGFTPHELDYSVGFSFRDNYSNDLQLKEWKQQLDSLDSLQGLPKKEMKKAERERKKIAEMYEERDRKLRTEQRDIDARAAKYRRIMSKLVNSAAEAISANDDF